MAAAKPAAAQTRAVQFETQVAIVDLLRGGALGAPRAFVPDRNRAGAAMAFRNRALERTVTQRVILDFHREMLAAYEKLAALIENIVCQDDRVVLMQRSG